jgi:hypothetical protein
MAQSELEFLSTEAAAMALGVSKGTVCNICRSYPGFAVRFSHAFKIPSHHIRRVIAGERPADIAAEVRAGGALRAA